MEENSQYDVTDIESVALHMRQFGNGQITLLDTYWDEGIALIEINNVEKKNAISGKMMVDFRNCISKLESWKQGKAVIIYGSGSNFCSGGDLDFARNCSTTQDGFYLSSLMHDVLERLEKLPLISIALVHGPTVGGGTEVVMACDYVLVCENVKFGFVHGKMGITTAWGATTRLVRAIGKKKALDLLLTSKILNASDCLEIGIASDILTSINRMEKCLEWVRIRTQHDHSVIRTFKKTIVDYSKYNHEESIYNELKLFVPLWGGKANKEALQKNIKHIEKNKDIFSE